MGCIKDVLKILDAWVILRHLLHAITCYYSTYYDNFIIRFVTCYNNVIIRSVTCYYIALDFYYDVFVALTNPLLNTRMTDFFMLSYIVSLPILNIQIVGYLVNKLSKLLFICHKKSEYTRFKAGDIFNSL